MGMQKANIKVQQIEGSDLSITQFLSTADIKSQNFGNISVRDVYNSKINITQYLNKSAEYNQLNKSLKDLQNVLQWIPEDKTRERMKASKDIEQQKKSIEQFKVDVLRLAETLDSIELSTDRLKQAKVYFENGQFKEVVAILDTEDLDKDLKDIEDKERKGKMLLETAQKDRKTVADHWLVIAQSTALIYTDRKRIEKTIKAYEKSINAKEDERNCIKYADFLNGHHRIKEAKDLYYKGLLHVEDKNDIRALAILSKLGILEADDKEFEKSLSAVENAIALIVKSPQEKLTGLYDSFPDILECLVLLNHYLASVANTSIKERLHKQTDQFIKQVDASILTDKKYFGKNRELFAKVLMNLGRYYMSISDTKSSMLYFNKAIALLEAAPESGDVSDILAESYTFSGQNYLASNPGEAISIFKKALTMYTGLEETNPSRYLLYSGFCQRLLAMAYIRNGDIQNSVSAYSVAIDIYEKYAANEPDTFQYHLAEMYAGLSAAYRQNNDPENSIDKLLRAAVIYQNLFDNDNKTYLTQQIGVLSQVIYFYYDANSAGKEQMEFMKEVLVSPFNLYVVLFEISNVYARNTRADLVPGILEQIERSFAADQKPGTISIHVVIQAFQYHGELLEGEGNSKEAIKKYHKGLETVERYKTEISQSQKESFAATFSIKLGDLFLSTNKFEKAIKYYQHSLPYFEEAFANDLGQFQTLFSLRSNLTRSYWGNSDFEAANELCLKQKLTFETYVSNYKEFPLYLEALSDLAYCCYTLGNIKDAKAFSNEIIKLGNSILKLEKWKDLFSEVKQLMEHSEQIMKKYHLQ